MKVSVIRIMVLLTAIVLLIIGCASSPQDKSAAETGKTETPDLFANETGPLKVVNETGLDVVVFAGKLGQGIVLGGVRGRSSRDFDLSKIENLPSAGLFILRAVSADAYTKKGILGLENDDVVYSDLVVYDLGDPAARITKTIPEELGLPTDTFITISNYSRAVCIIRLGSLDGMIIAALPPGRQYHRIWIAPDPQGLPSKIFPLFFNPADNTYLADPSQGSRFDPEPMGGESHDIQFGGLGVDVDRVNLLFE